MGVKEHVFNDVNSYTQLDENIVNGILHCVPDSGMRTTDEDTLHHIMGDIVTVYTDETTQEVIAFSSTVFGSPNDLLDSQEISDKQGCYLAGATISKARQSTGFYKQMNESRINAALVRNLDLIFTRTQNPRVQSGIQAVLENMKEKGVISNYELERILMPGCYGHMLTEEKPHDDKVSFDELDYENGDAYVLLFSLQNNK